MKSIIARLNAITNSPVVFLVDSKKDSQIDAFIDGQIKRVGIEVYQHSQKLTREDAVKVAKIFAEHENIPVEEIVVRERLPKTRPVVQHNRRTNDANLTLVSSDKGDEKQTLAKAAQELHDTDTKGKSTPDNPEGAVVKPQDAQPRKKRAYNKKSDKEVSKRSAAALKRYQEELAKSELKSMNSTPEIAKPEGVNEEPDADTMRIALALAKILKGVV